MSGKQRKFKPSHPEAQKAHLVASKGGVWDKQCVSCRWIYVKFHKECPHCHSADGDLVNHINDPDHEPGRSEIPYLPTPREIRYECRIIREGWDERRLANQEAIRGWNLPVLSAQKKDPEEE